KLKAHTFSQSCNQVKMDELKLIADQFNARQQKQSSKENDNAEKQDQNVSTIESSQEVVDTLEELVYEVEEVERLDSMKQNARSYRRRPRSHFIQFKKCFKLNHFAKDCTRVKVLWKKNHTAEQCHHRKNQSFRNVYYAKDITQVIHNVSCYLKNKECNRR
ncbi:hypothetical protein RFI_34839, partial [Reticulomyxa filosa]